jgi:hypothetical protein
MGHLDATPGAPRKAAGSTKPMDRARPYDASPCHCRDQRELPESALLRPSLSSVRPTAIRYDKLARNVFSALAGC